MKKVVQRKRTDCGVACVAMVAGVTYSEAHKALGEVSQRRTQVADLRKALRKLGIGLGHRSVPISPEKLSGLPFDCLLKTRPGPKSGNWHWMVWNSRLKEIFDPLPEGKAYKNPAARVAAYIQVKLVGKT
jgi:ABC-type bacteriocin/lantibiotic exporter with double-glycine peptidase domain